VTISVFYLPKVPFSKAVQKFESYLIFELILHISS
jgi:hypothetical protein